MNKEFEDIIKQKFESFEAPTAPDLFDQIVARRKKRRAALWITWSKWAAAVLLLLFFANVTVTYFNDKAEEADDVVSVQEDKALIDKYDADEKALLQNNDQNTNSSSDVESHGEDLEQAIVHNNPPSEIEQVEHITVDNTIGAEDATSGDENVNDDNVAAEDTEDVETIKSDEVAYELINDEELLENEKRDDITEPKPHKTKAGKGDDAKDGPIFNHRKPSPWSLELTCGVGYASRLYYGNNLYKGFRRSTESPSMSYQVSGLAVYRLNKNWNIATGINYIRRNEIFNFEQRDLTFDTTINSRQVVIYHPVNPPQTITVYDSVITKNQTIRNTSARNSYSRITIPLQIERMFYISNKWSFSLRTAALFTLQSYQSGTARIGDRELIDLSKVAYNRSGGVSAMLGLGARYRVNNRIQILVCPQLNFDVESQNTGTQNLKKREFGMYTNFGLSIDL